MSNSASCHLKLAYFARPKGLGRSFPVNLNYPRRCLENICLKQNHRISFIILKCTKFKIKFLNSHLSLGWRPENPRSEDLENGHSFHWRQEKNGSEEHVMIGNMIGVYSSGFWQHIGPLSKTWSQKRSPDLPTMYSGGVKTLGEKKFNHNSDRFYYFFSRFVP